MLERRQEDVLELLDRHNALRRLLWLAGGPCTAAGPQLTPHMHARWRSHTASTDCRPSAMNCQCQLAFKADFGSVAQRRADPPWKRTIDVLQQPNVRWPQAGTSAPGFAQRPRQKGGRRNVCDISCPRTAPLQFCGALAAQQTERLAPKANVKPSAGMLGGCLAG